MIGRWAGAVSAFKLSDSAKVMLQIIVPVDRFRGDHCVNTMAQQHGSTVLLCDCVIIQIVAFTSARTNRHAH